MNSNSKHGAQELNLEICRISSENDQLRQIVGLMQENIELRYVLRDHEVQGKSCVPPPEHEKPSNHHPIADPMKESSSSAYRKPSYEKRTPPIEGLGKTGYSVKDHRKQEVMEEYESESSSDSLLDPQAKEQRKFCSSVMKLPGSERGSKDSRRSSQTERRRSHF